MIILGVDPGVASVGYGVIEYENFKFRALEYGTFHTGTEFTLADRLLKIHEFLMELIERRKPDCMSAEELFFNTNVKTAIMVGHGRGAILLSGAKAGIPVFEYTPLQIKQSVVGYGRADKNQVQQMVKIILNLKEIPKPDDTADGLAVAICHAHASNSRLPYSM